MSMSNFEFIKKLGQGSFGQVEKVRRLEDNQYYALKKVKYMSLKQKNKKSALNQVRILASIDSENVIKYKQAFFEQGSKTLCIVMQLAPNGDLSERIKQKINNNGSFYQYQIWSIGKNIIDGLIALHEKNIIHRDLKPANIFFGEGNIAKIGDLNVSLLLKEGLAYTQTGTPYYASPQVWDNQPYAFQCDVWSFGCIMYQLCCLRKPFEGKNMDRLYEKIKKLRYDPLPYRLSNNLVNTIQKCLTERSKRISLVQLKRIFQLHNPPKVTIKDHKNQQSDKLMQTIKQPVTRKDFSVCLPPPKYKQSSQIIKSNPQIQECEEYSILDKFLSPHKKQKQKLSCRNIARSEKYIQPYSRETSLIQIPTFKQIINIKSPQKVQIKNVNLLDRLKLRRKKIQVTVAH